MVLATENEADDAAGRRAGDAMSTRAPAWLAYSMLALALLFGLLGCFLLPLNGRPPSGDTWYTLAFSAFPVVGVVIASRRPRNPIGWMFCVIGLANGLTSSPMSTSSTRWRPAPASCRAPGGWPGRSFGRCS